MSSTKAASVAVLAQRLSGATTDSFATWGPEGKDLDVRPLKMIWPMMVFSPGEQTSVTVACSRL
eukprot:4228331-Amphidinium_carterae.1